MARWVIGRGLLGNAIARSRPDAPFRAVIPWSDRSAAAVALRDDLHRFVESAEGPLSIAWCAGKAVTSSPQEALDHEVAVFQGFLEAVFSLDAATRDRVRFFLASSVGASYAGSTEPPFTEDTEPAPMSRYGLAKQRMETELRSATRDGEWRSLIGRLSNIYGPGQDLGKSQGLISVIVASGITGRPVSIYVPLDTLRDYIFEDDAAQVVSAGLDRLGECAPGDVTVKIVAAMSSVSIGAIIAEIRRVRRRRPLVVLGGGDPTGQSIDLRVRSTVWTDLDSLVRTTLAEGIDAVYRSQLSAWARSHG